MAWRMRLGVNGMSARSGARVSVMVREFVSADAGAKKITVRNARGAILTLRAEGPALAPASKLRSGRKVLLTCRDDQSGQHEAVTMLVPVRERTASTGPFPSPAAVLV